MIDSISFPITTTALGAATKVTPRLTGKLHAIYVDLGTATAADVTLSVTYPAALNLFSEASIAADAWRFPRQQVHGPTGTALTYDGTQPVGEPYPVTAEVTITIANGGAAKTLTVTLLIEM